MKSVTTEFKTQGNLEKPVSRWPVAGPSEYWLLASSPASKVKIQQYTHSTTNTHKIPTPTQDNYNNTHGQTNNNYTQDNLKLATIKVRQIVVLMTGVWYLFVCYNTSRWKTSNLCARHVVKMLPKFWWGNTFEHDHMSDGEISGKFVNWVSGGWRAMTRLCSCGLAWVAGGVGCPVLLLLVLSFAFVPRTWLQSWRLHAGATTCV